MTDLFFGIHWAFPRLIIFVPIILIAVLLTIWYLTRISGLIKQWQGDATRRTILHHASIKKLGWRTVLTAGAVLLLSIALMRPQWGVDESVVMGSGRAVLIVLDVSRSMCAQDMKPSRMARAKEKIYELVGRLKADRVGLLIFSGEALLLCPLTTDYAAFRMFLDNVAVEAVSSGTTSIGSALEKSLSAFGAQSREKTRLLVLFTDGEDFGGNMSNEIGKIKSAGVRVCIVGVGSRDGGPIPVYNRSGIQNGFLKDQNDKVVISRPQMALMRDIAEKTGGLFVLGTDSFDDIERVRNWIEKFEQAAYGERQMTQECEQFFRYTAIAFIFLLLGWML